MNLWSAQKLFGLAEVLEQEAIGDIEVGSPVDRLVPVLGPPVLPPSKLNRRSRIWSWVYGNLSVLASNDRIDEIQIDFEGNRSTLIDAGIMRTWGMAEWRSYAEQRGLDVCQRSEMLELRGPRTIVALD